MSLGSLRIPSLRQFQRDTRLILISSGIICVGFFGVQSLLKVLYVLRLGYGLGYIGVFTATPALMFMAMSLPSGAIGTRFGLKRTMVFGAVLATAGMALLPMTEFMPDALSAAWPIFTQMVLMFGWTLLFINMIPALMSSTTVRTRDDAYALMSMLRGAGAFFGTIVGGLLPAIFAHMLGQSTDGPEPYRWALLLGAGFGLLSLVPLLMVQIEDVEKVDVDSEPHGAFPYALVAITSLYVILMNAGFAVNQSFGAAYMDTALSLSTANIGFITAIGQFLAILAPIAMPYLGVRRSHAWTLMMVGIFASLMLLPMALISNWQAASFGRIGLLAVAALWMPALQVFQMTVFERHWRSLAYGAVSTAMGFSYGFVSLLGGFIAAALGYSVLFMVGASMASIGAAVMWGVRRYLGATMFAEPDDDEEDDVGDRLLVDQAKGDERQTYAIQGERIAADRMRAEHYLERSSYERYGN